MAYRYLRGESIRIASTIYGATSAGKLLLETGCKVSVSTSLEDESTKDDTDNGWDKQSVNTKSWNVSADTKIKNDGTNAAVLLKLFIDQNSTTTIGIDGISGSVGGKTLLTQLDIDAPVKQDATLSLTFTGVGMLSV